MRDTVLSIRVEPELKAALQRAAADERRSMASYMINAIQDKLIAEGYMARPRPQKVRKNPRQNATDD